MTKEELEKENKRLTELLNHSNVRLAEEQLQNVELEEEKCELLGLIQAKDKLIKKMKSCGNCKHYLEEICANCISSDRKSLYELWELAE